MKAGDWGSGDGDGALAASASFLDTALMPAVVLIMAAGSSRADVR